MAPRLGCGSLALLVALWVGAPQARAAAPSKKAPKPPQGTSAREAREDAVRAVPYARLDRAARGKVSNVLANPTIFRRLPTQTIECDPHLYIFLVEHPDLVVNIWDVMGISDVSIDRVSEPVFDVNDRAGTRGRLEFVYRGPDLHVVYAHGSYTGPMLPRPVRGECVLLLRSSYIRSNDGRYFVRAKLDAFLRLENVGVGMLAKTFQPLVTTAADHNFRETVAFVASVSRAAEVNYAGVQRLADRLAKVTAECRQQFTELTAQLAVRAAMARSRTSASGTTATAVDESSQAAHSRPQTASRPSDRKKR